MSHFIGCAPSRYQSGCLPLLGHQKNWVGVCCFGLGCSAAQLNSSAQQLSSSAQQLSPSAELSSSIQQLSSAAQLSSSAQHLNSAAQLSNSAQQEREREEREDSEVWISKSDIARHLQTPSDFQKKLGDNWICLDMVGASYFKMLRAQALSKSAGGVNLPPGGVIYSLGE